MNIEQLKQKLDSLGVSPTTYSLDGSYKDEASILARDGAKWLVYYSERGQKSDQAAFDTIDAACDEILSRLASDRLNRVVEHDWDSKDPFRSRKRWWARLLGALGIRAQE